MEKRILVRQWENVRTWRIKPAAWPYLCLSPRCIPPLIPPSVTSCSDVIPVTDGHHRRGRSAFLCAASSSPVFGERCFLPLPDSEHLMSDHVLESRCVWALCCSPVIQHLSSVWLWDNSLIDDLTCVLGSFAWDQTHNWPLSDIPTPIIQSGETKQWTSVSSCTALT